MLWSGRYEAFPEQSDGWIAHAPLSTDIGVEVAFLIKEILYFGPDDDLTEESERRFSKPIYQPALPMRANRRILSSEALRDPGELVKYYRDVIDLARKHSKQIAPADPYFWLRPVILEADIEVVSFGWSDTFEEATHFLSAVRASADGQLFWNVDQGWHTEVVGRGPDIFIRAGDPHYKKTFRCFGTSRRQLSEQSSTIEDGVRRIRSILVEAIGSNYWDYPPRSSGATGVMPGSNP